MSRRNIRTTLRSDLVNEDLSVVVNDDTTFVDDTSVVSTPAQCYTDYLDSIDTIATQFLTETWKGTE